MNKVGRNIRELVVRPDWQELRKSLLGTWKVTPIVNIQKLRTWLGKESSWEKRIIVLNYLTGSGFRLGLISHPEIDKLREEVKS